jgi:hypothetical protein
MSVVKFIFLTIVTITYFLIIFPNKPTWSVKFADNVPEPVEILVLVIAGDYADGTYSRIYQEQRKIWNEVAVSAARLNVQVYMVSFSPSINSTLVSGNHIKLPGTPAY